jgi:DNA-binding transcriptional regulator GbsR (MarR family)
MNDDEQLRSEQERFIEDVGIYLEEEGFPRMAGRILGWLLICEPPRQSAGELAEALQASRGSISTMTQLLTRIGLIERLGVPGERQDYFMMRPDAGTYLLQEEFRILRTGREILERGLRFVAEQSPENRRRLEEFIDFYAFFEREWPGLLERWHRERARRAAGARPLDDQPSDSVGGDGR